jgi:glyoxylase-like metal-dependent hydrolase (beta-lactamase superfamily II)
VHKLADGVWFAEPRADTDRPILALVRGSSFSLMIDGGNSPAHARSFLSALREEGLGTPDFIVLTHAHGDHVFGLPELGGMVVANSLTADRIGRMRQLGWNDTDIAERVRCGQEHEMTLRMLAEEIPGDRTALRIRAPDIVFQDRLDLDLGGVVCHIHRIGGDHAADSTVISLPGVAFIGDCLYLRGASCAAGCLGHSRGGRTGCIDPSASPRSSGCSASSGSRGSLPR